MAVALRVAAFGVVCCFLKAVPDDRALSAGLWDVAAVEMSGEPVDREFLSRLRVAYRPDGSWTVLLRNLPVAEGTSTIDPEAAPKAFAMQTLGGVAAKPRRYIGIYRIDAEERLLCLVPAGMPRPDAFTAPRGSGRVLVTLRRAPPP